MGKKAGVRYVNLHEPTVRELAAVRSALGGSGAAALPPDWTADPAVAAITRDCAEAGGFSAADVVAVAIARLYTSMRATDRCRDAYAPGTTTVGKGKR